MKSTKIQVKLYATDNTEGSLESYIPVFHRWVKDDIPAEMVFDVADYTHVPHGNGVLLVGHACDYAIDQGEGRPGILYSRKRDLPEGAPLVKDALARVLDAAKLLDADKEITGPKAFVTKEILFAFPDRLHLSNDEASFEHAKPAVEEALSALLPGVSYSLSREGDPRQPLTIRASA